MNRRTGMSSNNASLAGTSARSIASNALNRNDKPFLISSPVSLSNPTSSPNNIIIDSFDRNTSQAFCLRWNNFQANMLTVFDYLYQNEKFVDCTLACDGVLIKAHKMVLSASSPYFEKIFAEIPCPHPVIIIKDIAAAELKQIVEFMYKGEINVQQDEIKTLLQVAELLKVRGLADITDKNTDSSATMKEIILRERETNKARKSTNLQKRSSDVSSTDCLVPVENSSSASKKRKTSNSAKKITNVNVIYPEENSTNSNLFLGSELDTDSIDVQSTIPVIDIKDETMSDVSSINPTVSTVLFINML